VEARLGKARSTFWAMDRLWKIFNCNVNAVFILYASPESWTVTERTSPA